MAGYAIVPDIEDERLTRLDMAGWNGLCRFAQWEMKDGKPTKTIDGSCYPSIQMIADKAKISAASVCRALNHLEELGYIKREQRKDKAFSSTMYTLFTDPYRQVLSQSETRAVSQSDKGLYQGETGVVSQEDKGYITERQGLYQGETGVVSRCDKGCLTVRGGLSHSETLTSQYNKPINKPERSGDVPAKTARKISQWPIPNMPYDTNALGALTEMYELVPEYVPDTPLEIRFLQELAQEYPDADLFRQFRRARDWLDNAAQSKKPKRNLRRFLRNWIAHGEKYGENIPVTPPARCATSPEGEARPFRPVSVNAPEGEARGENIIFVPATDDT